MVAEYEPVGYESDVEEEHILKKYTRRFLALAVIPAIIALIPEVCRTSYVTADYLYGEITKRFVRPLGVADMDNDGSDDLLVSSCFPDYSHDMYGFIPSTKLDSPAISYITRWHTFRSSNISALPLREGIDLFGSRTYGSIDRLFVDDFDGDGALDLKIVDLESPPFRMNVRKDSFEYDAFE